MEQLNVYDLLGDDTDPVYKSLLNLKKGESITLEDMDLSLNHFGIYELSSETWQECFRDIMDCYRFICRVLKVKMWDEDF